MISPVAFFIFWNLLFWAVRGVKWQKIAQDDKKICLLQLISQEPYIIWLSFIVHFFLGTFFIFSKFWFFGLLRRGGGGGGGRGVKGPKMVQNVKKFCLSHSISQESYIIWFLFMVLMCKMIVSSGFFFIFSKVWFSGLLGR